MRILRIGVRRYDADMRDRQEIDHDLLNYLTAILGFTELILEETPPGERRHSELREIRKAAQAAVGLVGAKGNGSTPQPDGLDAVERNHIVHMLAEVGGNKLAAARRLGISRRTLYRRLDRHGLAPPAPAPKRRQTQT
jgi:transcriptional regulator of acetoin/glycerol metabolism